MTPTAVYSTNKLKESFTILHWETSDSWHDKKLRVKWTAADVTFHNLMYFYVYVFGMKWLKTHFE